MKYKFYLAIFGFIIALLNSSCFQYSIRNSYIRKTYAFAGKDYLYTYKGKDILIAVYNNKKVKKPAYKINLNERALKALLGFCTNADLLDEKEKVFKALKNAFLFYNHVLIFSYKNMLLLKAKVYKIDSLGYNIAGDRVNLYDQNDIRVCIISLDKNYKLSGVY